MDLSDHEVHRREYAASILEAHARGERVPAFEQWCLDNPEEVRAHLQAHADMFAERAK